jgi:hypothetical protein
VIADLDNLLTALYVELTDRIIPSPGFWCCLQPASLCMARAALCSPPMARAGRFRYGDGNYRIGPQGVAAGPPTGSAAGVLT